MTGDTFTAASVASAVQTLRARAAKPMPDGHYRMFMHRRWSVNVTLDQELSESSYREVLTAWSLLAFERRREDLGKRGHVTAVEILARVRAL